jgi:Fe-S-cluster containining protein
MQMIEVPCGTCSLCCTYIGIKLKPADYDVNGKPRFIVMPTQPEEGGHYLGFNNDEKRCVYLHKGLCAIHNDKPETCRAFDCRKLTLALSKKQAMELGKSGSIDIAVWNRGKELILENIN